MKTRAKLLGMLALLALISIPLTTADSEEAEEELSSASIDPAGEAASPPAEQRSEPMMGDLIFDHDMHADELDLDCDDCHHETNAEPLEFPHQEYFHDFWIDCKSCHHEAGSPKLEPQSCYDCHDDELRGIADEHLSPKVILHQNCWECHEVETGAEASESCELCHTGMQGDI